MLKIIKLTGLCILFSQNLWAQNFQPARCETNNFGQIFDFLTLTPTDNGLDILIEYKNPMTPTLFPKNLEHIASSLSLHPEEVDSVKLTFGKDQCWQHNEKNWIFQCISDPHPLPKGHKILAEVTTTDGLTHKIQVATRLSITGLQTISSMGPGSIRPQFQMNITKPHPTHIGSIVLAHDQHENHFGYCRND